MIRQILLGEVKIQTSLLYEWFSSLGFPTINAPTKESLDSFGVAVCQLATLSFLEYSTADTSDMTKKTDMRIACPFFAYSHDVLRNARVLGSKATFTTRNHS